MRSFLIILLLTFCIPGLSQVSPENGEGKIRVSGIVINEETEEPVPFAAVYIKNTLYGTVADQDGYFTILAQPSDTLVFAQEGYAPNYTIIPIETKDTQFSTVERLRWDDAYIPELSAYPWEELNMYNFDRLGTELKDNVFIQSVEKQRNLNNVFRQQYQREWIYYNYGYAHPRMYRLSPFLHRPNNLINPYNWIMFKQNWEMGLYNDQEVNLDMDSWYWDGGY
jgi:hypothetical protein